MIPALKVLSNKYVLLGLAVFFATWTVQEWRHDAKLKRAYAKGIKAAQKQDKTDIKLADKFNRKIEKIEERGNELENKASNSNTTADDNFIRLFNKSL